MRSQVVVLGGGVGGTLVANLIARATRNMAHVTVIDATAKHVYQPGFLYVPFGDRPEDLVHDESALLDGGIDLVRGKAIRIDTSERQIVLESNRSVYYDYLVVTTGSRTVMEEVPGAEDAYDFYTYEGAKRLRHALLDFKGGSILIGVAGIPYKCPPAPVEFAFMLDDFLRQRGLRDRSKIKLLSPLNRAFTIEVTSKLVQPILEQRGIELVTFFNVESVDRAARKVNSLEGESIDYDLLILVPPHRGAKVIEESGLGDERGWIPVDKNTLRHQSHDRVWALGDATNIPISKSGSVAHYQAGTVASQVADAVRGRDSTNHIYRGKVMCFLETGQGEATTIRFDYDHPPVSPKPGHVWHWAKLAFNKTYWHTVPRGRLPE